MGSVGFRIHWPERSHCIQKVNDQNLALRTECTIVKQTENGSPGYPKTYLIVVVPISAPPFPLQNAVRSECRIDGDLSKEESCSELMYKWDDKVSNSFAVSCTQKPVDQGLGHLETNSSSTSNVSELALCVCETVSEVNYVLNRSSGSTGMYSLIWRWPIWL